MTQQTAEQKAASKAAADEKDAAAKAAKASAKESEATKKPHVYRVDQGEALPPQATKTATDNE